MRKLYFVFLILLFCFGLNLNAQNMRTTFIGMPDSLMLLLTQNDRRDCIDFIDAGMRAVVTNRLGGKSELKNFTDDFLEMNLSATSVMQIKLLTKENGDTVICMVNTVCAEVYNSSISFYNSNWEKLDKSQMFDAPGISEFFLPSDSVVRYIDMADIYLVRLQLQSGSDSLRAEYTMPGYMIKEDSVRITPMLQPLWYRWDGKRFTK